ncbi:MAG TPA: peptidyl-prolyl cis-trans isomerase [Anaeromyxobacteraceae bacterium]
MVLFTPGLATAGGDALPKAAATNGQTPLAAVAPTPPLAEEAKEAPGEPAYAHLKAPLFDERFEAFPVAQVDDDVIELRELTGSLASAHESRSTKAKADRKDFSALLDRLVDARLLVHDARDTGLDELPEIQKAIADFRQSSLTEALKAHATKATKADPAAVQRLYEAAVREWKVKSVLFPKAEDANQAGALVAGGKSFDDVAKQAVEDKKASGGEEGEFVAPARMLPSVAAAVERLSAGVVSAPIEVKGGWALVQLEAVRTPENPKARAEAEAQALSVKKGEALQHFYAGLVKKWVKIDEALLKRLDYESPKPGFEGLKQDKRALVRIQGEKPITVGEFSTALEKEFFHGIAEAIRSKKINRHKPILLDALISKVIVPKEARRLGLDATAEYRRRVADYESSLLFGTYLDKAIIPNVKVQEEELKKFYEQHKADYAYPAFYRLEGLGFHDVKLAQASVEKLRAGTDFKWLKANTEGQVKDAERKIVLDGGLLSVRGIPAGLANGLAGSKKGDYRLYSEGDQHYVVHVLDEIAASEQPYAEVRESIAKKIVGERVSKTIKETADKLRGSYDVKVFITRIGS